VSCQPGAASHAPIRSLAEVELPLRSEAKEDPPALHVTRLNKTSADCIRGNLVRFHWERPLSADRMEANV